MPEFRVETGRFQFVPTEMPSSANEFERESGEFGEDTAELEDKTEVIICTHDYRLRGKIALVPGARLTDYMIESRGFIAATDVEIQDKQGHTLMTTPFLDINRDHIVLIIPAEFAQIEIA